MSNGTKIYLDGVTRPDNLKGCPFCGQEPGYLARASEDTPTGEFHAITCYCDGYSATAHQSADTQAEAVARWNQRLALPTEGAAP